MQTILQEYHQSKSDIEIILGSGFSYGMGTQSNKVKLIYKSLIDEVETHLTNERIRSLVTKNKANEINLEHYIRLMHDSTMCIPFLNNTDYLKNASFNDQNIREDIVELKKNIIDTIEIIHPTSWMPFDTRISSCANNMRVFRRIYTLNYDLVLYWVFLRHNDLHVNAKLFRDGFAQRPRRLQNLLTYSDSNNHANVLYLHGAIHLVVDSKGDTRKICKSKENGWLSLTELIPRLKKSRLLTKYNNLVVLEGTEENKTRMISQNSYLHKCYQRLRSTTSDLIIYGCSILNNDELNNDTHIWYAALHAPCKKIFIGIHIDDFTDAEFDSRRTTILNALDRKYCLGDLKYKIDFFRTDIDDLWSANHLDK